MGRTAGTRLRSGHCSFGGRQGRRLVDERRNRCNDLGRSEWLLDHDAMRDPLRRMVGCAVARHIDYGNQRVQLSRTTSESKLKAPGAALIAQIVRLREAQRPDGGKGELRNDCCSSLLTIYQGVYFGPAEACRPPPQTSAGVNGPVSPVVSPHRRARGGLDNPDNRIRAFP